MHCGSSSFGCFVQAVPQLLLSPQLAGLGNPILYRVVGQPSGGRACRADWLSRLVVRFGKSGRVQFVLDSLGSSR